MLREGYPRRLKLNLAGRRRIQTSYSVAMVIRSHQTLAAAVPDDDSILYYRKKPDALLSLLYLQENTGSALHEILERRSHIRAVSDGHQTVRFLVFLKKAIEFCFYGIAATSPAKMDQSYEHALELVRRALSSTYSVPEFGDICLSKLGTTDMRVEAEFHLGVYPHWVIGYMDQIPVKNTDSSYRYFVLDWKSNWLPDYDKASIESSVIESRIFRQKSIAMGCIPGLAVCWDQIMIHREISVGRCMYISGT